MSNPRVDAGGFPEGLRRWAPPGRALRPGLALEMGALALALLLASGGAALAYEELPYEVAEASDGFELRRYAPHLVAETEVEGDFGAVGSQAFRILFAYISGENRAGAELPMTSPVTQQDAAPRGEKIAMTVPVTQSPRSGSSGEPSYVFQFVMPSKYTLETLPVPVDPRIRVREVDARLMAALRFSGTWRRANYQKHESALLDAVRRAGLEVVGPPVFARYDAPFMLWFLRRNEVLVEVRE